MSKVNHLYLHFPYDHFSITKDNQTKWLRDIIKKLDDKRLAKNLKTLYIGGNNFGALAIKYQIQLFRTLSNRFGTIAEFSVESDPQSIQEQNIELWKKHKVNRLVLKIKTRQNDKLLKLLINKIKQNNILNICLDIYFDSNQKALEQNILLIKKIKPQAVYWYCTKTQAPVSTINKIVREMKLIKYKRLEMTGFVQKEKFQSLHSYAYYQSANWIGLGKGAYSFVDGFYNKQKLSLGDFYQHILIMALKHKNGLNLNNAKNKATYIFYQDKIEKVINNGDLLKSKNRIYINPNSWIKMDDILLQII